VTPYRNWRLAGWRGDVLVATDPTGRQWSIGEVDRWRSGPVRQALLVHPASHRLLLRQRCSDDAEARAAIEAAFAVASGVRLAVPVLSERAERVVWLLRLQGPMSTGRLAQVLGVAPRTARAACVQARDAGEIRSNGETTHQRWYAPKRGAR
jgi:hypothetical protein